MPHIKFDITEPGTFNVNFVANVSIPSLVATTVEEVVGSYTLAFNVPTGNYIIDSITVVNVADSGCTFTYNPDIPIDCKPPCGCGSTNFTVTSATHTVNGNYQVIFDACQVNPIQWRVFNSFNTIVASGTVVPPTNPFVVNLQSVANETYKLQVYSSGCTGIGEITFNVTHNNEGGGGEPDPQANYRNIVLNVEDLEIGGEVYNLARDYGVGVISYNDFHWGKIERTQGNFNYDEIDYLMSKFHSDGMKWIPWFKPYIPTQDAVSGYTVHNKVGGSFIPQYISGASTSYLPSSSFDIDRYGGIVNGNGFDLNMKASIAYHNPTARTAFFNFVARAINYIYNHPYKDTVERIGIMDGGMGETAFMLANIQGGGQGTPITDSGYHDDNIIAYRSFLQTKYTFIGNLNNAWGTAFLSFNSINRGNMPKTADGTFDMTYNEGEGQRDWYRFKLKTHRDFYQQFINIVKNPSTQINGLVGNTGFKTIAYVSENFTSGQGRTYGIAPLRYMYDLFDTHFSSCTAGGSPVNTNSYMGDLVLRQQLFRGTFGDDKNNGTETDGDPVENNYAPSKIFSILAPLGAKYIVLALQSTVEKWNRPVVGDDGVTRPLKEDVLRTRQLLVDNKIVTKPPVNGNVQYNDGDILVSPHDPGGKKTQWKNITGIDSNINGTMLSNVTMECLSTLVPTISTPPPTQAGGDVADSHDFFLTRTGNFISDAGTPAPSGYTNYYFIDDYPLVDENGNALPFTNINVSGLLGQYVMFRKIPLKNSTFPNYNVFKTNGFNANIPDNLGNILYNAQILYKI